MRPTMFALVPLLAVFATPPAGAQITARFHIDIPIGRDQPEAYYGQGYLPREITVYDYDRDDYGDWDLDDYYQDWRPVTIYFYLGRYFERPIRGARPIVIYRYRNRYFFPPRDVRWEHRYGRTNNWGRRDDRDRDDRYIQDRGVRYQDPRAWDDRNQYNGGRNFQDQVPRYQAPRYQDQRNQYNGGRSYQDPRYQDQRNQNDRRQAAPGQDQRNQNDRRQAIGGQDQRNQNDRRQAAPDRDQRNQAASGQDAGGRDSRGEGAQRQNDRRGPDARGGRSRP
jgi:hypothetical protein